MNGHPAPIRVGVFTLVALALGALVLVVFGGMHLFARRNHYAADFPGSVLGLEVGASVYFNGIEVGRVDRILVSPSNLSAVRVEFSVDTSAPVHTDTVAYVALTGLTGLKTVDLRGGALTTPRAPSGSTLPVGEGTLDKLQAQAERLAEDSDQLMTRAVQLVGSAQRVLANLERVTDPRPIAAITAETEQATRTLAGASRDIAAMVAENRASLHAALASLAAATRSAQDVMARQVPAVVGGAGGLVAELRAVVRGNAGQLRAALADLRRAASSFDELARELRERPSRLLFAPAPRERKLP